MRASSSSLLRLLPVPLCLVLAVSPATAQAPAPSVQIAAALQAAPEAERAGATVLGYAADGSVTTLREGSNSLICLADNPAQEGWSVACYHESIEPYMARGRELRAQGVTDPQEVTRQRFAEAESGDLPMPEEPAMLYVMTGDAYDAGSNAVRNPFTRWVLYTPWATLEETGLPPQPAAPGQPWLMFPGTPGAHIMVTPPPPGG
ncbi:MAG: hypothetical protein HKN72_12380 [Gemmatimonadetes bacterium]|nr:hypothetical protein [Gemmatimonadota bacterium]